jgi:hypothetical protein
MFIPLLIAFFVGTASGFTAQVIADRIKPADPTTIVCVATSKDAKPKCEEVENKGK